MSKLPVFVREATGLVREMSTWDATWYSYLAMGAVVGMASFFVSAPSLFPGANPLVAFGILAVICTFMYLNYAQLGASFPRSGGDYIFQSRIIAPWFGFMNGFMYALTQPFFVFVAARVVADGVLPSIFEFVGYTTNTPSLVNFGVSLTGSLNSTIVAVLFILAATPILLLGMRGYVKLQSYFMIPFTIAAIVIIILELLFVPSSTFVTNFNTFSNSFSHNANWYQYIISEAKSFGYNPNPGFSWYDTLGFAALLWFIFMFAAWWVCNAGEVKKAGQVTTNLKIMLGATYLMMGTFVITMVFLGDYMGTDFLKSLGYLSLNQPQIIAALPGLSWLGSYGLITTIAINNPAIGLLIAIIVGLAFLAGEFQILFNGPIGFTRIFFAQSFDRVLPNWLSGVNKYGAPMNAIYLCQAMSLVFAITVTTFPNFLNLLITVFAAQVFIVACTIFAGIIFPWARREIYKFSPASKYVVVGVPLITIAGIIGILMQFIGMYYYLTVPSFGIFGVPWANDSEAFVVGLFIFAALLYFGVRRWRLVKQGVDISLAFKQIPPE